MKDKKCNRIARWKVGLVMRRRSPLDRSGFLLASRFFSSAVLALFLLSSIAQRVLPIIHTIEIEAKEVSQHSCMGHPTSHVEQDFGVSHHDSGSCGVCQTIQSFQPCEAPSIGALTFVAPCGAYQPHELEALVLRGQPLTGSSPRAPPSSL